MVPPIPGPLPWDQRRLPGRCERRFNGQFVGLDDGRGCLTGLGIDEFTGLDWGFTGEALDWFTGNLTDGFTDGFTGEALSGFTGDLTDEVLSPPLDRLPRVLR